MKTKIAVTAGDPLGIGPEITVKALKDARVRELCDVVVIGDKQALLKNGFTPDLGAIFDTSAKLTGPLPDAPAPTVYGGLTSFNAVAMAARFTSKGEVKAMVTAPVSKESWAMAGVKYTGHTEFLKDFAKAEHVLMMFTTGKLNVGLVTEHSSIKNLSKDVNYKKIIHSAQLFNKALVEKGFKKPCIGVAAVNPHAGDGGKLGTEELEIIKPAVSVLKKEGLNVSGPFPVDSLWTKHAKGLFDGIICMYHDQAMIGLKLVADAPVVHITYGLPFLRTSPTHGTAFDIAGRNKADHSGMTAAILYTAEKR
ncbi:MAG: 4-hydroxythreonine-4-phosphate dehydrogenase PdxA [Elusimicrobium sp.]|jgi:4-hydroxythreonine-4-phosphate dehydrogenase|nr:4-hydroxythreonine-4-phosphate dehydrogenase PdxA [Elusimicrobium sp.]